MRFGVVGTNFISKEFLNAGKNLPAFRVTAVCSRTQENAENYRNGDPEVLCFTDYGEFLNGPVDAVYIAVPNKYHFSYAKQALECGKHVFVEKPACSSAGEYAALQELAKSRGRILFEGMRTLYTPGFLAVKNSLDRIGTVRQASFSYCQYSSRYDKFKAGIVENAFDPSLCNGALMDIGVYCCAMAADLFGTPEKIRASALKLENGLDASGIAVLEYPGKIVSISYSKIADGRIPCEIQGEKGTIVFSPPTNPKEVRFIGRDRKEEVLYSDPDPEFFGMCHEISAFLDLCGEERDGYNEVTGKTLSVMDEIRRLSGIDFQAKERDQK